MCTQADHNVEPVAVNTQPTTAVVAAKPQTRVYSWEYGSPDKLNFVKSYDVTSEVSLSTGLGDNQVAYYFDVNNVPTHKRAVYHVTESVTPNDIIFKQDFMKTPNMATVSPYSVVVYDKNDLTKAIRSTDFSNEKDAKRVLGKLVKPTEVTYMYAGGVPVTKRFRGENSVQIVANDPIWNVNVVKPVVATTATPTLEARFYNKTNLNVPTKTSIVDKLGDYDYPSSGGNSNNGINGNQIVYIFENDKPIKKRGYFESFVNVSSTDPIWEALKIKEEPKAQIEIRVYSQNDLNTAVLSKIVESFDELEWRKTPLASDKIAYAFVDGKPVKSRKGNMKTEDVLSLDQIWETLKPKLGQMVAKKQFKVVSYKSAKSINTVTKEAEFDNMSDALDALKKVDMGYDREEMRYLFKDGVAIKKRLIDKEPDDVTATDVFFPNGIPESTTTPVVSITPAVDTEKPATLQEFLKELMKAHEDKKHTYFDYIIFQHLLKKFWPEKVAYYSDNKSSLTSTYRMFDILNSWNPPTKKTKKKYTFSIHKLRHDFIIEAARLANTSNPSDKLVESIESFGKAANMFIGDWQSDIRVVLAKHFNNPSWLKNGVFTANNESYELEQIDMVIT